MRGWWEDWRGMRVEWKRRLRWHDAIGNRERREGRRRGCGVYGVRIVDGEDGAHSWPGLGSSFD